MKSFKFTLIMILGMIVMVSCEKEGGINDEVFAFAGNAPLATWVKSATSSKNLKLSDPSSKVSFEVEFIDASNGSSVENFKLLVADSDSLSVEGTLALGKELITQSSFTANSNGKQGFSGSFSLSDIATALGKEVSTFKEGDKFYFSSTVTSGGVEYRNGNSNTFSKSVKNFTLAILTETVKLTWNKPAKMYLNASSNITISMAFSNDVTDSLRVLPTITRLSVKNNTSDNVGNVMRVLTKDKKKDSIYTFTYRPSSVVNDTISFVVSGASALANGFVMKNDTMKNVFIIDNSDFTRTQNISELVKEPITSDTTGYQFLMTFSKNIGSVSMSADIVGKDDDGDDKIDEEGDATKLSPTFSGRTLDYTYPWKGKSTGVVKITLIVKDRTDKPLNLGIITLTPN